MSFYLQFTDVDTGSLLFQHGWNYPNPPFAQ